MISMFNVHFNATASIIYFKNGSIFIGELVNPFNPTYAMIVSNTFFYSSFSKDKFSEMLTIKL